MQKTVAETAANAPDFPADPAESGYNPVLYSEDCDSSMRILYNPCGFVTDTYISALPRAVSSLM